MAKVVTSVNPLDMAAVGPPFPDQAIFNKSGLVSGIFWPRRPVEQFLGQLPVIVDPGSMNVHSNIMDFGGDK